MAIIINIVKIILVFVMLSAMTDFTSSHLAEAHGHCPIQMNENEDAVLLPHPSNCSLFYICNYGVPVGFQCPAGLHFNPRLMVCDWPNHARCKSQPGQPQQSPSIGFPTYRKAPPSMVTNGTHSSDYEAGKPYLSPQTTEEWISTSSEDTTSSQQYILEQRQQSIGTKKKIQEKPTLTARMGHGIVNETMETSTTSQDNTTEPTGNLTTSEAEVNMTEQPLLRSESNSSNTTEPTELSTNTEEQIGNTTTEGSVTSETTNTTEVGGGNSTMDFTETTEESTTDLSLTIHSRKSERIIRDNTTTEESLTTVENSNVTDGNDTTEESASGSANDTGVATSEGSTNTTRDPSKQDAETTEDTSNTTDTSVMTTESKEDSANVTEGLTTTEENVELNTTDGTLKVSEEPANATSTHEGNDTTEGDEKTSESTLTTETSVNVSSTEGLKESAMTEETNEASNVTMITTETEQTTEDHGNTTKEIPLTAEKDVKKDDKGSRQH